MCGAVEPVVPYDRAKSRVTGAEWAPEGASMQQTLDFEVEISPGDGERYPVATARPFAENATGPPPPRETR
jgi:hypothetical protein